MKWRVPTRRGCFLHITSENISHVIKTARKESGSKESNLLCSVSYSAAKDILNNCNIEDVDSIKALDVLKRQVLGSTFKDDIALIVVPYESIGEVTREGDLSNICGPIRQWPSCQGNKNGLPSVSVPRLKAAPYDPATNKSISVDYFDTNRAIDFMNEGSICMSLLAGDARLEESEAAKEKGTRKVQRVNEMSLKLVKEQLSRVTDKSKVYFPFDGGVFEGRDGRDGMNKNLIELLTANESVNHCEIRGFCIGEPLNRRLKMLTDVNKLIADIPDRKLEVTLANNLGTFSDLAMAYLVNPELIVEGSMPFHLGETLFALVVSEDCYNVHQQFMRSGDETMVEAVKAVNEWKESSDWFSQFPMTVLDISDRSLASETDTCLDEMGSVPEIFSQSTKCFPSLGYLQHLVNAREMLAEQLLTRHNVYIYERIMNMFSFGADASYEKRCLFLYLFSSQLKSTGTDKESKLALTKISTENDLKLARVLPPSYAIIEGKVEEITSNTE